MSRWPTCRAYSWTQVEQDPLQGRGRRAVPALARLAHLVKVVPGDHRARCAPPGPAARRAGRPGSHPAPRASGRRGWSPHGSATGPALESPLKPAQLDVGEVLEQLKRRPAGRQPGAPQLVGRAARAASAASWAAEVAEVAGEHLGAGRRRIGRLRERDAHGDQRYRCAAARRARPAPRSSRGARPRPSTARDRRSAREVPLDELLPGHVLDLAQAGCREPAPASPRVRRS